MVLTLMETPGVVRSTETFLSISLGSNRNRILELQRYMTKWNTILEWQLISSDVVGSSNEILLIYQFPEMKLIAIIRHTVLDIKGLYHFFFLTFTQRCMFLVVIRIVSERSHYHNNSEKKFPNFVTLKFLTKQHMLTVQNQIRKESLP